MESSGLHVAIHSLITIKMNVDFHVKVNDKIDRKVLTYPLFFLLNKILSSVTCMGASSGRIYLCLLKSWNHWIGFDYNGDWIFTYESIEK